jgi:photosystem II stability/assembly factor-like uncharacterized protein
MELKLLGHGYTSTTTSELPATTHGVTLKAINDNDALVTVGSGQSSSVYATTDGGATWAKVVPPARGESGFTVPPSRPPTS